GSRDSGVLRVFPTRRSSDLSKEGVVKDLQAMKSVGINRAFIGNIGLEGIPFGDVKIFSEEWWDILHTALKTASELDIDIGIFNRDRKSTRLNSSHVKISYAV